MSTPRDDALDSETDVMNVYVVDQELAKFQQFCLMVKPLQNRPKMHLHGLPLDLRKTHSHLKSSAFGYSSDGDDKDFNSPLGSAQAPTKYNKRMVCQVCVHHQGPPAVFHTASALVQLQFTVCPTASSIATSNVETSWCRT